MTYDDEPPDDRGDARTPPQDVGAEQSVLGCMMLDAASIEAVVELIAGSDFYRPSHETIFETILDLYGRGEPADMLTVGAALGAAGTLGKVGGAPYLHTLVSNVPVAVNAPAYAAQVRRAATFRRLTEAGTRIAQRGYLMQGTEEEIIEFSSSELTAIEGVSRSQDYHQIVDLLNERLDELDEDIPGGPTGVPTGFYDLDALMNGFKPGQFIVIAGRPGSGKSTLALDFCRSAAIRNDMCTGFFSLEMGRSELVNRTLSAEARVPLTNLVAGRLNDSDWDRIASHAPDVMSAPFFIDDSANMTMPEIRAKARRLKSQHGLRLVVIDYLQLMSSGKRVENRQVEVSEFSRQIKLLAKELEVPIIGLSQLNRGPEQRSTKRPALSDLRESGAIEQDADVVILVHRDDMYEMESSRPGEADLIVAKHRNGPTRDVVVAFQGHYSRFADMARPV